MNTNSTDALSVLRHRISANKFDPQRSLSEAEIRELIDDATQAPSSFNIQHWRFIAVTDPAKKAELQAAAYNQEKVSQAPVTFVVLGDTAGHEKLPEILRRSVDAGIVPQEMADTWIGMANGMYGGNERMSRDEAIRSASLPAMALMFAAEGRGLVSGPMIGFDPAQVQKLFAIPERFVPVMLLPVGYPAPGNWRRKPRLRVDEVLSFNATGDF